MWFLFVAHDTYAAVPNLTTESVYHRGTAATVQEGRTVEVRGQARNTSTVSTGQGFTDAFQYRYGSSGGFTEFATEVNQALAGDGVNSDTATYAIPAGKAGQTLYVQYCVDARSNIAEADESLADNCEIINLGVVVAAATSIQPPTTFTATPGACGTKKITLNWSAVPGATGYEVQRNVPGGVGGVWINVGNVLTHTHSNLPEGSTYTYKVRAKNATGQSTEKVSSPVTVTAPVKCETPTTSIQPPATFYAVPGLCGTNKIYFNWSAVPGATGYDGQIDGGAWFDLGNVLTTIHSNVEPGSEHTYNIRARNANGFGPSKASNPVKVTAPVKCEIPTTGIQPPATLTATPGACGTKKITLNWSAVPGATGYEVQRSFIGGAPLNSMAVVIRSEWINVGNVLTHTHSNLPEGSMYRYSVRAKNATGQSTLKESSPAIVTAPVKCETPTTSIQPPTTFTATPGACGTKKITLNWSAVEGATGYEVQRNAPGSVPLYKWINVGNVLTYTHSNLTEGNEYSYIVRAKNATGQSTEKVSSPVTVTAPVKCGSTDVSGTAKITSTSNTGDRDTTPNMKTAVGLPFTISGTATTQELYIVYGTEGEKVRTTVPVTDGKWTLTFPKGWSKAGQYEVRATRSKNSLIPYLFTKFVTVNPSVVTVTSNVDPLTSKANKEITISGTARSVSSLGVNVKSPSGKVTTKTVSVRYTGSQNGTWSVTFKEGFSETGRHDITFTSNSLSSLRRVVLATKGLVITGGTTGDTTAIQPPTTFTATPGACGTKKITLNWSEVPGATGYEVQKSAPGGAGVWISVGNFLTYTYSNLPEGSVDTYKVRAKNATGRSAEKVSSPVTVTAPVKCETSNITSIQPPTTFTATPGACGTKKITLNWSAVEGATGYEVQRSVPGGVGGVWINVGNLRTHTHSNLPEGSAYTYKVRAKNATGQSTEKVSSPVTVTAPVKCGISESSVVDVVQSEYTTAQSSTSNNLVCTDLPSNLSHGTESPAVRMLQDFLYKKGLMSTLPTGFYGDQTKEAVKLYQRSALLPETGMVYEFTRSSIKNETCK